MILTSLHPMLKLSFSVAFFERNIFKKFDIFAENEEETDEPPKIW